MEVTLVSFLVLVLVWIMVRLWRAVPRGHVLHLFISPRAGQQMIEMPEVVAVWGKGLEGDRYALGRGAYSKSNRPVVRHVTLIAIEAIREANAELNVPFLPRDTRRNIVTEGIDLNLLVGKRFMVGGVHMQGVELCAPCARPSALLGRPGVRQERRDQSRPASRQGAPGRPDMQRRNMSMPDILLVDRIQ